MKQWLFLIGALASGFVVLLSLISIAELVLGTFHLVNFLVRFVLVVIFSYVAMFNYQNWQKNK